MLRVPAIAAVVILCAASASAQVSTGTILGTVVDQRGVAVAGAQVVIRSRDSGRDRAVTSSEHGHYAASLLAPGAYTVSGQLQSLRSASIPTVVQAGMTSRIDLVLAVDVRDEAVTVRPTGGVDDDHQV